MKYKNFLISIFFIMCVLFAISTANAGIFEFKDDTSVIDDVGLDERDSEIDLNDSGEGAGTVDINIDDENGQKQDFGFFKLFVPEDVDLVAISANNDYDGYLSIVYFNNNSETFNAVMGMDAWFLEQGKEFLEIEPDFKLIKTEGDLKIYKDKTSDEDIYWVIKDFGNSSSFGAMGQDLDALKEMINSLEVVGIDMYGSSGHFDDNGELVLDEAPSYIGSYN